MVSWPARRLYGAGRQIQDVEVRTIACFHVAFQLL